ncbi:MAG: ester cyclase, partial [Bacteroidales bacterium]
MKKSILLLAIAISSVATTFAQKSNLDKNLKIYEKVWDDIVNKGQIDQISTKNFDENIVLISKPENIAGIEAFKAYYQNFLTGFSNIKFTVEEILGSVNKIVKHWNFKVTHTGVFFGIPAAGKTVD